MNDPIFQVLESTPIAQFALGIDHRITHWNRACEQLTGYSAQEMIGTSDQWKPFYPHRRPVLADLIIEDDFKEFLLRYKDQNPGRSTTVDGAWEATGYFENIGGKSRHIYFLAAPIFDSSKKIIGAIETLQDITEQKQRAIASEEAYESLRAENARLRSATASRYRFGDLIGKSQAMQEVYDLIIKAASSDTSVIIYGESGTGKELVAKKIHSLSSRSKNHYVPVNCGAISENLIEREFFGHRKGAFTGAHADQPGLLDRADGGTLFLDEIGEISLPMQVKLLRVLDGGGFSPLGSSVLRKPNLRIIAATSMNLLDLVSSGRMRKDFFFRIHIIPIHIPPLRERKEDLRLLIDHFLSQYRDKGVPQSLPDSVRELLCGYEWPGNIRELQNVLHRYMTLERLDFIASPKEFSSALASPPLPVKKSGHDLKGSKEIFEKETIEKVLRENKWHRGNTAATLGISRKTLFRKMKKLGLL